MCLEDSAWGVGCPQRNQTVLPAALWDDPGLHFLQVGWVFSQGRGSGSEAAHMRGYWARFHELLLGRAKFTWSTQNAGVWPSSAILWAPGLWRIVEGVEGDPGTHLASPSVELGCWSSGVMRGSGGKSQPWAGACGSGFIGRPQTAGGWKHFRALGS